MSRIGKQPVEIPSGVTVTQNAQDVTVKGPKGELSLSVHPNMSVAIDGSSLQVTRPDDVRENRALHGLTRSLIQNMVDGVQKQFERRLTIVGVGYNATLSGN